MLYAYASTTQDTLYSFCGINGVLPVPVGSVPPWSGQATVWLGRWIATTHGVLTSRETNVTVSFSVTQDSTGLALTLGPPLDTTLTGSALQAGLDPTNGTWTCPRGLPFRDDPYLVSHGYQAAPTPSGNWSMVWMNHID